MNRLSILHPDNLNHSSAEGAYKTLSETTCHDLGLDSICRIVSAKDKEQRLIRDILARVTDDPDTANFRADVFEDILRFPSMRARIMELLDKIQFLRDYRWFKTEPETKTGIWDFLHRLEDINDYIECVEALRVCLSENDIRSEGLVNLRTNIEKIYNDSHYTEMKADIKNLRADTSSLKSVTVGVNLNERFEVSQVGVISVNNKPFRHSVILNGFSHAINSTGGVQNGNDWNGDMHFVSVENPVLRFIEANTLAIIPDQDSGAEITHTLNKTVGQMLRTTVKKLQDVLSRYVTVSITDITYLIPEFLYYIRFAEFIEAGRSKGLVFCKAAAMKGTECFMAARGFYNLKLATVEHSEEIVVNDLDFDREHIAYILTGANRGGKTTVSQAIGLLYVLAQGGIHVPADSFEYVPVDGIYTHFPADEDKTMNLGRLGEECTRFKELFDACTERSLLLLNESFSTTSFEEGYYIARDCVRAILSKRIRTVYNTHMHKLARDIDEMNAGEAYKAASLVVRSEDGICTFKIEVAPPEGMSYAKDIADKYGVTYELLTGKEDA